MIHSYNLEYPLWALALGILISNTAGVPRWLAPALAGEFFIKTGLVIFGAEVLFSRLLELGLPGVMTSWLVTPVVLVVTYWFGVHVLAIPSRSLCMVVSADMSVCGVSAAIATGAACRARKEELSLAIGLSLFFTVFMMVAMPPAIRWLGLDPIVGGAWLGGTIDATGAVVAAGEALGKEAGGFVCMGLQTNFRELAPLLASGRPVVLYVCGQLLNLILTLAMAGLTFGWLFRRVVEP